jgi:hypothetical protein
MCSLLVNRMNDDICQIRLQLDVFEIAGPNEKGNFTATQIKIVICVKGFTFFVILDPGKI